MTSRRVSARNRKDAVSLDIIVPEKQPNDSSTTNASNRKKRPRPGGAGGQGGGAKRGPKTKEYLRAQLQENVRYTVLGFGIADDFVLSRL